MVEDLTVKFPTADGVVSAVNGLSYSVPLGRTLAIVGESGSGKSVSSMAVMGLHDRKRTQITGSIRLGGDEIVGLPENELMKVRGDAVAMVFQDPQSSLHPLYTVGNQITEAYRVHHKVSKEVAKKRALEMLDLVGIPNPQRRFAQYPHEFSGGMRQRAMIAMGLVNDPKLVIADEPTTALDVTVQAQILDLLNDLQKEFGSGDRADHPRPGCGGRDGRRRPGDVRRPLRRVRHRRGRPGPPADALHLGPARVDPDRLGASEQLRPIKGLPPSLLNLPTGCSFNPRCPYKDRVKGERCTTDLPELLPVDGAGAHVPLSPARQGLDLRGRGRPRLG